MRAVTLGLLLVGCGPVLLRDEDPRGAAGMHVDDSALAGQAADTPDAAIQVGGASPSVSVSVKPLDCGRCFDLQAVGAGGQPPYVFAWDNGSPRAERRVCVDVSDVTLSVVARDALGATSTPQQINLGTEPDAGCSETMPPTAATPPALLCLQNASFEGTPVANFGQPGAFDATPWTTCVNPAMGDAASNMPAIADENVGQVVATPKPTDGLTYLALGEAQQVSQPVCSPVDTSAALNLELDLARVELPQGITPEQVFLEIWGGLAADCSQRELLWASPGLEAGWKHFCITLHAHAYLDQITLRGNSDMASAALSYLLVDNLRPVELCP